jgi:hypothetical protein
MLRLPEEAEDLSCAGPQRGRMSLFGEEHRADTAGPVGSCCPQFHRTNPGRGWKVTQEDSWELTGASGRILIIYFAVG